MKILHMMGRHAAACLRKIDLKMKLTTLILIVSLFQLQANDTYGQKTKITLDLENVSLEQVFNKIESLTEFKFIYKDSEVDYRGTTSIRANREQIASVLEKLFKGSNVDYRIMDKQIILRSGKEPIELKSTTDKVSTNIAAPLVQQIAVSGTVADQDGQPLPGASIVEKGTTNGTQTDFDGNFSIQLADGNAILVVSYMGFATKEIAVNGQSNISISLAEDAAGLEEVVVVGFGTQKKTDLTGAVSQIKMDDAVGNRPVTDIGAALQGALPGFTASSGPEPGSGNTFNIRGYTSINGGGPLILVDNTVMNNVKMLNVNDIESVTVLKDASAAAIYGARAAFGVVLITTKKGKANQKASVQYSNNFSISHPVNILEPASPIETVSALKDMGYSAYWSGQNIDLWISLINEYNADPSRYPQGWTEVNGTKYFLKDTDPYGDMFASFGGFKSTHNLSVTGGSEDINYRISLGSINEDGVLITDKDSYRKTNVSSYVSTAITPWLKTSIDLKYASDERNYPNTGIFGLFGSNIPSYHPEGSLLYDGKEYFVQTPANMIKNASKQSWHTKDTRLFSHTEINPVDGLNINFDYSYQSNNINNRKYNNYFVLHQGLQDALNPSDQNTAFYLEKNFTTYKTINLYANYRNSFLDNHNFEVVGGYNQEENDYDIQWSRSFHQISNEQPFLGGSTGATPPETSDGYDRYRLRGVFGRLNYNYKEKYLLNINGRYDLSSKFPDGFRGGLFPSVSVGWIASKESFFEPLESVFSSLKLRGSLGKLGNQNIGNYGFLATMNPKNANWINNGQQPTTLTTPGLVRSNYTWEVVETLNGGVDFGILKDRLTGTFEIYRRNTTGMLAPGLDLPEVAGAEAPLQNAADLRTTGWELSLQWKGGAKDLDYGLGLVLYDSKAVITKYRNENKVLGADTFYEGMELGEIWGYVTDGFYTSDDFKPDGTLKDDVVGINGVISHEGDIKFKNLMDSEGSINIIDVGDNTLDNPGDRKVIGNSRGRYQYGFNGHLNYKNFGLSFLLQGEAKRDAWIGGDIMFPHSGTFSTLFSNQLDYWTPDNQNAYYGRIYQNAQEAHGVNQRVQTKFLQDASYLRVKNITLGYNLPQNLIEKLGISEARIFYSGENLFTFSNLISNVDPENLKWEYPYFRTSSIGLNVKF